nr:hypothetical protein CFP56_57009 [Quercus suber]
MAPSFQEHYSLSAPGIPPEVYHPLFTIARQHHEPDKVAQWYSQILQQVRGQRDINPSQAVHGQFSPISPDDERAPRQANFYSRSSGKRRLMDADRRNEQQREGVTQGSDQLLWTVATSNIHESPSPTHQDIYNVAQAAPSTTTALEVNTRFPNRHWVLTQEVTPRLTPQDGMPPIELSARSSTQGIEGYASPQPVFPLGQHTARISNSGLSQWETPPNHMPPPPPPPKMAPFTPVKVVTPRATPKQLDEHISPVEDLKSVKQTYREEGMSSSQQGPHDSLPWLDTQFYEFDAIPPIVTASFANDGPSIDDRIPIMTSAESPTATMFAATGLGIQEGLCFPEVAAEPTQYYYTESNTAMPILVTSDNNTQSPAQSLHPSAALTTVGMRMLMPQDNLYSPPSTSGNPHPRKRKRLLQPAPSPLPDRRRTEQVVSHS